MNKNRIIFTIIFTIFSVLSISTYYNTLQQKEYIDIKHSQSNDILQQMIDGKIIFFRKQFSSRIKNIIKQNDFKDAIINNDENKIKTNMNNIFIQLKKENKYSKTLHLISNKNITIYRAHKPQNFGDDLTNIRPIVKYVNKHKRAKYGFEAGLYSMILYRITIPIIYDNVHYGILEYGIDAKIFVNDLSSVSNYIKSAILVNKNIFKIIKADKFILEDEILRSTSNYIIFTDDKFFNKIDINNLKHNTQFDIENNRYVTFSYNLLSFNGSNIGKILIAKNVTTDKIRFNEIIKVSIINLLLLVFTIFIIVYYAFRYYEKKIVKLKEEEKQRERILHQQSKMASMGEMIGNIAHQWRQPLSVVSTVASGIIVQKEYGIYDEKTLDKSMETIVEQTEHMTKTIEDFRNFFKSDKEKVKFELNKVLHQNISLIDSSLKNHNIDLKFISDVEINLTGFQNELTQAILNILSNAKDQLIKLDKINKKFIRIKVNHDDKNVFINIIDNGGGVPENIKAKIFEPYFTTKHQSQGTGIGLYMTHQIITKHFNGELTVENGDVEIENTLYKCAIFTITLPRV